MTEHYTAADVIRNIRERLRVMDSTLAAAIAQRLGAEAAGVAVEIQNGLARLAADLDEHLIAIGGDPQLYSDGRRVMSTFALGPDSGVVVVWDPRRDHPTNQPHLAAQGIVLHDGTLADVIVSTPGVLDVVRRPSAGR